MFKRLTALAFLSLTSALAQKQQGFDVFTFTAPAGWQQASPGQGVMRISRNAGGLYCLFDLYRAAKGTGKLDTDFQAEWQNLVVKPFNPDGHPETEAGKAVNGWQNKLGGAAFDYQGIKSLAVLSTFSAGGQAASVLMLTNDQQCLTDFDQFLAGMTLKKPVATKSVPNPATGTTTPHPQPLKTAFAFSTTNFDDGWVSVVQKDWVLARKGSMTVYLHYPNEVTSKYYPDSDDYMSVAWNTLVAPRYSNLQGYKQDFNSMTYLRPHLAGGYATNKETGQQVYVSLFEQDKSGWIEVVTPDQQTFTQTFGVNVDTVDQVKTDTWDKLRNLRGLNRFAVAASDLQGEWSSSAGGMTQWVNTFTGLSAGATGFSSNQTFEFSPHSTYKWSISMASGVIGAQTFSSAESSGKLSMKGNWQINFSDIDKKPRLYNAYFEAGRNDSRVLWLQDTSYGGYSAYLRVK